MRFRKDPFGLFSDLRRELGDLFLLPLPGLGDWVCVCSPDLANDLYAVRDDLASAADFNNTFLTPIMGPESFVGKDGDEHRRRRGALTKYLNGTMATARIPTIRDETLRQLADWPENVQFPLLPRAMRLSLGSNYRVILGLEDPAALDEVVDLTIRFFDAAMKSPLIMMPFLQWDLGPWSPWGRIVAWKRQLRDLLGHHVETLLCNRSGNAPRNVLEALADFDEGSLPKETIVDDLLVILNAAQETSSRILTWTIAGLLSNPAVLEKVSAEIDSHLGTHPIEEVDLDELDYLDAAIQEGIRYRPFSPFISGRKVRAPFNLGGYSMPVGSTIIHAHAEVCVREDLFPNVSAYDPDSNFHGRQFPKGHWAPFGGGVHLCLGRGVALLQLKVALATILRHSRLELLVDRIQAVPSGFLFVPKDGLPVRLSRRS